MIEQTNITIQNKLTKKIFYKLFLDRGVWYKQECDDRGKEIYFESSDGYWHKFEYDSRGNRIYYENSDGYWYKREYNDEGKQIYFENSEGYIKR